MRAMPRATIAESAPTMSPRTKTPSGTGKTTSWTARTPRAGPTVGANRRTGAGTRDATDNILVLSSPLEPGGNVLRGPKLRWPAVKVDAGVGFDLGNAPATAREVEEIGYDGVWSAETSHDPLFPLLL